MSEQLKRMMIKFNNTANDQEQKGIKKYGKPLNPLDNYNWLEMCLEEQVDGAAYIVAEMDKRSYVCERIRMRTNDDYIHGLLDLLEGKR